MTHPMNIIIILQIVYFQAGDTFCGHRVKKTATFVVTGNVDALAADFR